VGGEIFLTCPDRPWGPPILLHNRYRVFPGGKKRPGRDTDQSLTTSAVGHERVELYLYSPYGPYGLYRASVPVQGCTLLYSRAIPLLPLWAVRHVQSLSACTRVRFTFTFIHIKYLIIYLKSNIYIHIYVVNRVWNTSWSCLLGYVTQKKYSFHIRFTAYLRLLGSVTKKKHPRVSHYRFTANL
jgi:hypothetical protein